MTEPYTQDFSLYEQAHWLKVQKFSKYYWNSFSRGIIKMDNGIFHWIS